MGNSDEGGPGAPTVRQGRDRSGDQTRTVAYEPTERPERVRLAEAVGSPDANERYQREAALGAGGMGEVHACRDDRLGRQIALKRLRGDLADDSTFMARFLREAQIQGQLEHPAIVPLYDLDESEGVPYFTMKRVRGLTLSEVIAGLREGDSHVTERFGQHKLLTAFSTAAQAVHYAHVRGVVHRDLKPHNVMLGDFGEVYVLDWGIAKLVDGDKLDIAAGIQPATTDTITGDMLGTAGYMSPEQVRSAADQIDPRSDVYSLGVILFELLTLRRLNPGDSLAERCARTLSGVDVVAAARDANPDLPPELVAICARATRLEPSERYANVQQMIDDLERFLEGDRDAELRRSLSRDQSAAAARLVEQAVDSGLEDERHAAAQRVGRALALDPDNAEARGLLVRLLTQPPQTVPQQVKQAVAREEEKANRTCATAAAGGYLALLIFVPFAIWMSFESWPAIVVLAAIALAASATLFAAGRWWRATQRGLYPGFIVGAVLIAGLSSLFGPLIVVPGMSLLNTIAFLLSFGRVRLGPMILGCAAVAAPLMLQLAGVLPASYAFSDGNMLVLPWALELPPVPTLAFLTLSSLFLITAGGFLAVSFRRSLTQAHESTHLFSWQLSQLLPRETGP